MYNYTKKLASIKFHKYSFIVIDRHNTKLLNNQIDNNSVHLTLKKSNKINVYYILKNIYV